MVKFGVAKVQTTRRCAYVGWKIHAHGTIHPALASALRFTPNLSAMPIITRGNNPASTMSLVQLDQFRDNEARF